MAENYKDMDSELSLRPKIVKMKPGLYMERSLLKPPTEVCKETRFCKKSYF